VRRRGSGGMLIISFEISEKRTDRMGSEAYGRDSNAPFLTAMYGSDGFRTIYVLYFGIFFGRLGWGFPVNDTT
jgi:hypothetical protein